MTTALKLFRGSGSHRVLLAAAGVSRPQIRTFVAATAAAAAVAQKSSIVPKIQPGKPKSKIQFLPEHRYISTTNATPFFISAGRDGDGTPSATPKWTPPSEDGLDERPVLIVGAGNMGRRIGLVWASASRPVTLYDTSQSALDSTIEYITENLGEYCASRGTHPGHVFGTTDARIAATTGRHEGLLPPFSSLDTCNDEEAADCELHSGAKSPWLAIDCLPDDLNLKIQVLSQLEDLLSPSCILASNSSCLATSELITRLRADIAPRLLNTHYFIPPRNRMVELMSSTRTDPAIFDFLTNQMRRVGFIPMVVPPGLQSTGFIFNRIWGACKRETLAVLSEGVSTPGDIDALFRDFFHAEKGPCERMDEVGLDVVERVETHALEKKPEPGKQHVLRWLRENYLEQGKLGDKSGEGLFTKKEREGLKDLHERLRFADVDETRGA